MGPLVVPVEAVLESPMPLSQVANELVVGQLIVPFHVPVQRPALGTHWPLSHVSP
jgi:hypothetical protein